MTIDRLNWPNLQRRPNEWVWKLWPTTQTFVSPLNGGAQTLELPGARWWCKVGFQTVRQDDWRIAAAWLAQMRGMAGRVLVVPLQGETPRGVATGTPVVSGSNQTGRSLVTSGWAHNVAQILKVGDYFSVPTASGPELKILTAEAASDNSGNATLAFEPPLRAAPANGAALTVNNPVCPMRMIDDAQGEMSFNAMHNGSWTIELVESWL